MAFVFRFVDLVVLVPFLLDAAPSSNAGHLAQEGKSEQRPVSDHANRGAGHDREAGFPVFIIIVKAEVILDLAAMSGGHRAGIFVPNGTCSGSEPSGRGNQEKGGGQSKTEDPDNGSGTFGEVVSQQAWNEMDLVAQKASEPCWQRPAVWHGQGRKGSGGESRAEYPVGQPFAADPHLVTCQQAPSPENNGHEKHGGCQPDGLHQDVGNDRTRSTKGVARRFAGRMVQARIRD